MSAPSLPDDDEKKPVPVTLTDQEILKELVKLMNFLFGQKSQ